MQMKTHLLVALSLTALMLPSAWCGERQTVKPKGKKMQKLELTWVGKDDPISIEPRILIEDAAKSNTALDSDTGNMLVHGDNLLALKALEAKYAGQVKCIYIDPPFNTGTRINADGTSIGYEDGLEHSIWLNMMYERLKLLHKLLADDGALFVHLDDNESDYCKVMLDEIFGRKNFMNRITVAARSPSAFSVVNPGLFVAGEYILYYAKDRSQYKEKHLRIERKVDYAYDKWIENFDGPYTEWSLIPVSQAYKASTKRKIDNPVSAIKDFDKFIIKNARRICRFTAISDTGAGQRVLAAKQESLADPTRLIRIEREDLDPVYILDGEQLAFYAKNILNIGGKDVPSTKATDIWTDIAWEGIAKEGGVTFKKGKKPEKLIQRVLLLSTNPGDLVLDSFLGSGTTAAVAHKMGRRWIGIEMGDHAYTHCKARLDKVVSGEDKGGISKSVEWKGGGGYRFYELAPTLIRFDDIGEPVINEKYDAEMLATAVALHEGFVYAPDAKTFWKQAVREKDGNAWLFTTTRHISRPSLAAIAQNMKKGEYLVVVCKSFDAGAAKDYPNITVKKIPPALLGKCEFGKDGYPLNIYDAEDVVDDGEWEEDGDEG